MLLFRIFNLKNLHRNYFHLFYEEVILYKQQDINSYDVMNRRDTTNYQEKTLVYIAPTPGDQHTHHSLTRLPAVLVHPCGQHNTRFDRVLHHIGDLNGVYRPRAGRAASPVGLLDAHGQTALLHERLQCGVMVGGAHHHDPGVTVLAADATLCCEKGKTREENN